ncbi:MAG: 8-oxo-dGTP diphosphatase [Faecalibacterium sp.]|nr:8-oxo-dGTP diphosphatase [Ruminococcus sp.]MCM1392682.1 8-oxo-dGTP diphosphatase [Ruminococcus sp.]MCM1484825.1 8-oxo-dGTP diphosphatase [Faecalibacterium sp.]
MNRKTEVELTNMCLVCDGDKVLVQEKVGTKYNGGLVFPGGHVEPHESLNDSIIREIKEETGLTILNPKLCGVKDWITQDGTRYIVMLYKAIEFAGELKSSDEGEVFWLERRDIPTVNLIWNMRELLEIFDTDNYSEFFFKTENGERKVQLI